MTEITDGRGGQQVGREAPFSYRDDPAVPSFPDDHPIIVYDGRCRLCSGLVHFVLRHDRRAIFRFVAAQSDLGAALYRHYGLDPVRYDTYIVLEDGRPYFRSAGSFRLFARLGFPWSILRCGRALPSALTDGLYDLIARNRIRWFGQRRTCLLLAPGHADRFLG